MQLRDLLGLALLHRRAELVGGDVLREIEAEPIKCKKCAEKERTVESFAYLQGIRYIDDEVLFGV